jgi:hypothetical protein
MSSAFHLSIGSHVAAIAVGAIAAAACLTLFGEVLMMSRNVADKSMAGELGFEPRLTESESAVLPLNYSPTVRSRR